VRDAAVAGSNAYLATACGIKIVDVSDPANPFPVASIGGADSSAIEVHGSNAYVATSAGGGGLSVIDISDPAQPFFAGFIDTPGTANDVTVSGNYAYVADGGAGLAIIDVSTSSSMAAVSQYGSIVSANRVQAGDGGLIYVTEACAMRIINATDPSHPFEAARLLDACRFTDAAIAGNHAFILMSDKLQVYDVSNPAAPALEGSFKYGGSRIVIDGGFAYLLTIDIGAGSWQWAEVNRLQKLDISDPLKIFQVASYSTDVRQLGWRVGDYPYLAFSSNHAYFPDGDYVRMTPIDTMPVSYVLDENPGTIPDNVAEMAGSQISFSGLGSGEYYFHAAVVNGSEIGPVSHHRIRIESACGTQPDLQVGGYGPFWASYADYQERRLSIDLTTSNRGTAGARGIEITGLYGNSGVSSCNTTSCENPLELAGAVELDGAPKVAAAGEYAYVAASGIGLVIYDISDIERPIETGRYGFSYPYAIAVKDRYVYVGASPGANIIDVGDPAHPVLTSHIDGRSTLGIAFKDHYAYLTNMDGMLTYDITDPAHPILTAIATMTDTLGPRSVTVSGNYAYVVSYGELKIFDLTNPAVPAPVGSASFSGEVTGVAVKGNYAFVTQIDSSGWNWLRVLDVSDETAPFIVTSYSLSEYPSDIEIDGDYAHVIGSDSYTPRGGDTIQRGIVHVFDISKPDAPFAVGYSQEENVGGSDAYISGGHIIVGENPGGLRIYTGVLGTPKLPIILGDLMPGDQRAFRASFRVPSGVGSFRLRIRGTATDMCGNTFRYGS